jgi:phosphoribosylformimino-5-aminoimidazole carboxamide ribotide isomerase
LIIIPAVDIKEGRCVRLEQGRLDSETVYADDPVWVARRWESLGAQLIHIVDLDAAVEGRPVNFDVIKRILTTVNVPVQIGGGMRDTGSAEKYLSFDFDGARGVKRIIIGTAAYEDPELVKALTKKYPGRVAIGIDANEGKVAIRGWVTVTDEDAVDLARKFEGMGVACIIYTDISRDGMLSGPNLKAIGEMAGAVDIPVVASGGVSSIDDIESLKDIGPKGLEGVIIGKALYSGDIDLSEAIRISRTV